MLLNHLPCDGKTDSKPVVKLISVSVEVEEPVKDTWTNLGRNSYALVFDRDAYAVSLLCETNFHFSIWRAEFYGIIHQGGDGAFE